MSCVGKDLEAKWRGAYVVLGVYTSIAGAFVALTTMIYARQTMVGALRRGYWWFVASSGVSLGGSQCQYFFEI